MRTKLFLAGLIIFLINIPWCVAANNKTSPKIIAISFDDGPSIKYTEKILEVLQQNDIHATFFVVGQNVKKNPDVLKKVFTAGNQIGSHSYTHPNFSTLSSAAMTKELTKTNEQIHQTINIYPTLFRPPFGACPSQCKVVVSASGLKKVTWDYMVNDWDSNKTSAAEIASNVIKHAKPNAIITMHDGGGNREKTLMALPTIISTLKQQGYQFVTIGELLQ
jgi:peptidoglycan-N-acetylglucosamine deacetylase